MQVLERLRRHPLVVAAVAGLVVGAAVGLARPIRAAAPDAAELGAWIDFGPGVVSRYDEGQFARVRLRDQGRYPVLEGFREDSRGYVALSGLAAPNG